MHIKPIILYIINYLYIVFSTFINVHQASLPLKTENVEYALSRPSAGHVRGLAYAKSWFVFARQNFAFTSKNNAPNTWQRVSEVVSLHCQSVDSYPSAGNPQTIIRNAARRVPTQTQYFFKGMIYLLTHSCHPEHSEGSVYINYRSTDSSLRSEWQRVSRSISSPFLILNF